MKFSRKETWVVLGIVLAVAASLFGVRRFLRYRAEMVSMSIHDRVTNVVQGWARLASPPSDKQELEVIWSTSGRHFEFFPYAAQELTTSLKDEFHDSKKAVLEFTDIYANTNTNGKIKTVRELATAVRQNYRPQ